MFRVMLAQSNELKIVFTADRNVFACCYLMIALNINNYSFWLVLNLGHSPLYRHFYNFLCYSISDKITSGVIPIKIICLRLRILLYL